MTRRLVIAVDGYSSCGKSTFARLIAKELNYIYIDSGAMYRTVALFCLRKDLITESGMLTDKIVKYLSDIHIEFIFNPDAGRFETFLNSENVEEEIRKDMISGLASKVSQIKEVRARMVEMQRRIGIYKGIVMDGRDIGTVVFPDADIKIFMMASVEVRARRRFDELVAKGYNESLEEIMQNVIERDRADESREISPLRKADDALVLDNSSMTINEQMEWFRGIYQNLFHEG